MTTHEQEAPLCTASIRFPSDVTIKFVGVNHTADLFQRDLPMIQDEIRRATFVGVESDGHLAQNFKNLPPSYFSQVTTEAWRQNKPILCSDPAVENTRIAKADFNLGYGTLVATGLLAADVAFKFQTPGMRRRNFLKLLAVGAGAFVTQATGVGKLLNGPLCDTPHTPNITDEISFAEFRNASMLLGYDVLSNQKVLQNASGIHFGGTGHNRGFLGFAPAGTLDEEQLHHSYKTNLFRTLCAHFGQRARTRVWLPDSSSIGAYTLRTQITLDDYVN